MQTLASNPDACKILPASDIERIFAQGATSWRIPMKGCLTCSDKHSFNQLVNNEPVETKCNCVEQHKLHFWMLNAGINLRYQRLAWEDLTGVSVGIKEQVYEYIRSAKYLIAQGQGLTLWSKTKGSGKTSLSTLVAKKMLAHDIDVYTTTFSEMLDLHTAGWRNDEERRWFIRRIRNAEALFIDDIGREHKGRAEVSEAMLDAVIRHRVSSCRPTFITTNLTPDELRQGYGANVFSLLSEVNQSIEVAGDDFRPQMSDNIRGLGKQGISFPIVVG